MYSEQQMMTQNTKQNPWKKVYHHLFKRKKRIEGRNFPIPFPPTADVSVDMGMVNRTPLLDIIKLILLVQGFDQARDSSRDFCVRFLRALCFRNVPLEVARFLFYKLHHKQLLTNSTDNEKRRPLHHAVASLCNQEMSNEDGIKAIKALFSVDPAMIHATDINSRSPLDIVQICRSQQKPDSSEDRRLGKIYECMKHMSIAFYKNKKRRWEGLEERPLPYAYRAPADISFDISSTLMRNVGIHSTASTISSVSTSTTVASDC